MPRRRSPLAFLVALAGALAVPALAHAETFCVHTPANCAGTTKPTLQSALDAALANGGAGVDTIRLGTGLFNDPAVDVAGKVEIVGEGANKTAIRTSSTTAGLTILDIKEPDSIVRDLRVHHNSGATPATGLALAGDARDVMVTNQGPAGQFDGIRMTGAAKLDESAVDLVYPDNLQNRAVFATSGANVQISDSYLSATVGASITSGDATISRTRIRAQQGVVASSGAHIKVRDTEIRVPGPFAANFTGVALFAGGPGATTLEADRITAVGNGTGYGVWAAPTDGAGNTATIHLRGSVIHNFGTDRALWEGAGFASVMHSDYSAYRFASQHFFGSPVHNQGANDFDLTGVDPKFIDPGPGNLRLRHDSPLVDRGDPSYQPLFGGLDVVSRIRRRDGDGNGAAVVDLGAHEYQRAAPTAVASAPATAQTGELVTFLGSGKDPDGEEPLSYAWTFDDGGTATGPAPAHAFAAAGTHTATLAVTDATGLTATAQVAVSVVESPAPPTDPQQPAPDGGGGATGPGGAPAGGGASGGGGGASGGGATRPARNVAPVLGGARLAPARFRAGLAPRRRAASRKSAGDTDAAATGALATAARTAPRGTTIRFRLSEAATMTFVVERPLAGRRAGRGCVRPTRANRRARRCTRWVRVGAFTAAGRKGANARRWDGRLRGRVLVAGRYRLGMQARDGGGLRSRRFNATFQIARG